MLLSIWLRLVSGLVPWEDRADWREDWAGELAATNGTMTEAWGALPDGNKEKQLLQGLLNQRDNIEEAMKQGELF